MKFDEMGMENGKTMLLLPGTACTWQINFAMVIDDLKERYHLICVNYDGFDGDNTKPFTDMITVTEKIEEYILQNHDGRVDGAYGSSLGGSFVGLLVQRERIHIDHAVLGGSDLDQGGKAVAKVAAGLISHFMNGASKSQKKKDRLMNLLKKGLGIEMTDETAAFMDQFSDSISSLHPKTVSREYYSDYITPLNHDIHVNGTTVHIIYAKKMGEKYLKRYYQHFRDPDIIPFDMPHEAWLFSNTWKQPVLEALDKLM